MSVGPKKSKLHLEDLAERLCPMEFIECHPSWWPNDLNGLNDLSLQAVRYAYRVKELRSAPSKTVVPVAGEAGARGKVDFTNQLELNWLRENEGWRFFFSGFLVSWKAAKSSLETAWLFPKCRDIDLNLLKLSEWIFQFLFSHLFEGSESIINLATGMFRQGDTVALSRKCP